MKKHLNVLAVEDSEDDALLLLREIKKGGYAPTFVRVQNAGDMLACLNDRTWDIVISDYSLPEFSALEALNVLQETGLDLPFIVMSGKVDDEVAVECMTAGAHDFIRKNNMVRLIPAIERELNEAIVRKKRKEAEDALQESEERYETLFDGSPDAIFLADLESGEIIDANQAASKLLQKPIDEIIGLHQTQLHPDRMNEFSRNEFKKQIIGNNINHPFETLIIRSDGMEVPVEIMTKIVMIKGKPVRQGIFRNITERKRADDMLRLHSEMLENMGEGVYLIRTSDGIIVYTNPRFEQMFGYAHGEMIGQHVSIVNTPTDISPEEKVRVLMKILMKEGGWHGDIQNIKKDGTPFWCHANDSIFEHSEYGQVLVSVHEDITERKQAEEEIVKLARFNESIVTSIPVGIVTMDQAGKVTSANDVFLEIVGSPNLEETLKFGIHTHSVEVANVSKAVKNTLMTGSSFDMNEMAYTSHWGKEVIINLRGVPLKDMDGNITGVVLVIDDVTDMTKAEHALHESEVQYRALFEASPDAIFLADPESSKIIDANQAASKLLQKPIDDIIGLHQTQLHPPKIYDYSRSTFKEHAGKNETSRFETIMLRSDGSEIPVEVSAEPITIKGRQVLQGVFRDITDRKLASMELEKSEKKYRTIIEHSNDMIWSLDTEGNFTFFNKHSEELTGYKLDNWIGKSFAPLIHEWELQKIQNIFKETMAGNSQQYEVTITKKDGSDMILSVNTVPVFESGEVVGTISFGRDVTHTRQTEEKLKKSAEELAISNEQLKSLDRMKDEFLSNISHELKTPLISIKGFSEVVQDELYGPLNEKQKKAMDTVVRNSERLSRLINSILYLTVQKSGRDSYTIHPVNITEIIGNALIDISPQANSKDLTIENNTQSDLPWINGEMDKLTQVFINLFENATKFTPNGGKIAVAAFEDGENIHITVTDDGIGISSDVISNLFERFYQVDASTTRKYGGTGIGLYISKLIVEVHKGKIWAESEEGAGTTFHVLLPK